MLPTDSDGGRPRFVSRLPQSARAGYARNCLAMAAAGKVRCEVATRPLTQVNEVFEQLRRGQVHGRMVLVPR